MTTSMIDPSPPKDKDPTFLVTDDLPVTLTVTSDKK